jgi:hypothetical protein
MLCCCHIRKKAERALATEAVPLAMGVELLQAGAAVVVDNTAVALVLAFHKMDSGLAALDSQELHPTKARYAGLVSLEDTTLKLLLL